MRLSYGLLFVYLMTINVESFVPRAIGNTWTVQQAPEHVETCLPTELDEQLMLTEWDPVTKTEEIPSSNLFSSHDVLCFGDGGQKYCKGGGYKVHTLQVEEVFAETMNGDLYDAAGKIRALDPSGLRLSNEGGWHSSGNLLDFTCVQGGGGKLLCGQAVESFRAVLEEAVRLALPDVVSSHASRAWMNVNRVGNYNEWHHHGKGFSGVYYVNIPKTPSVAPTSSGCLAMRSWRKDKDNECKGNFSLVRPIDGMVVIFPSTLLHSVVPFFQAPGAQPEERISIAFNV